MSTASIIAAIIAVVSAVIAAFTIINSFRKVRKAKNITITKKNGDSITVSKDYNRHDSKKLLEFMK